MRSPSPRSNGIQPNDHYSTRSKPPLLLGGLRTIYKRKNFPPCVRMSGIYIPNHTTAEKMRISILADTGAVAARGRSPCGDAPRFDSCGYGHRRRSEPSAARPATRSCGRVRLRFAKLYTNIFFRPLKDKISGVADDRPAKHFPSLPFQGFVRLPDRIGALPAKSPSPASGIFPLVGRRLSRKSAETAVFSPDCAGDV